MKLCRNCDGFIPPEITNCPNCGVKPNKLGRDVQSVQKIVSGIASLSVGMTLMACYGLPPSQYEGKGVLIALLITENTQGVQAVITAPSDQGTLTIELGKKKFVLAANQKSEVFILYPEPYHFKITDSQNNILFEDSNFNFAKNSKDGIIIKSESKVDFSDNTICYNLNGISGKLETIKCSEINSN